MLSKSLFLSKTFWFNLIAAIVAISVYVDPNFLTQLGIDPVVQKKVMAITGLLVAFLNIVLRLLTTQPTTLPGSSSAPVWIGLLLCLSLSGCFAGNLIKSDCKVIYSAPLADTDSSSYLCVQCKNKILLQAEDSILIKYLKK
jgi:hypothetical protein